MKIQYFFLFLLLSACSSNKKAMRTYGSALFQHWTHSYEEDKNEMTTYRPASFAFPPSRGREGFEIKEDGTYIRHAIGRADAPEKMMGTWEMKGKNTLIISMTETKIPPFEVKILSVEQNMLTIQK
jgi:hypothetical protein